MIEETINTRTIGISRYSLAAVSPKKIVLNERVSFLSKGKLNKPDNKFGFKFFGDSFEKG